MRVQCIRTVKLQWQLRVTHKVKLLEQLQRTREVKLRQAHGLKGSTTHARADRFSNGHPFPVLSRCLFFVSAWVHAGVLQVASRKLLSTFIAIASTYRLYCS